MSNKIPTTATPTIEEGITGGTSATTFSPNATCTAAQILTFLYRSVGQPPISNTDRVYKTLRGNYYAEPLAWANGLKMIDDPSTLVAANTDCTRADTVYYLYKAPCPKEEEEVKDDNGDNGGVGSYIDWSWSIWTPADSE